jgi:hypothetical protein
MDNVHVRMGWGQWLEVRYIFVHGLSSGQVTECYT